MAVTANSIITPQASVTGSAKLTAANSSYDAPTTAVQLLASQTNGARLTRVTAQPAATVTATDVQLYTSPDGGTTKRHVKSVAMSAQTISAGNTTAITPVDFGFNESVPLLLAPGESLYAAISVAQTSVIVRAEGGAY